MAQRFSVQQVLVLVVATLVGVISSVTFHFPLVIGFLPGFLILVGLAKRHELPYKQILQISLKGLNRTRIVLLILFFVSFLLPSWYLSGTMTQMVQAALHVIVPHHFFVLTFLIAMCFSMLLGTSVGTLSSIGIPILGSAMVLHLPVAMVAGALVSGAFVGDRTSPFSSSHQMLSNTIEVPVRKQFGAMLTTSSLAVLFCLIFYGVMDAHHMGKGFATVNPQHPGGPSLVTFIPPVVLIAFVVLRLGIVYAFLSSILSATVIALFEGTSIFKILETFWNGVHGLGGGLVHMYALLLFLGIAGAYNGLLEELNIIKPYLDRYLESSRSLIGDTFKLMVATLFISLIAANQTLPIILTGRSFLPHWSREYGKGELARVMGDSTMLFPGMIPWSVLAVMCSTILGVPLLHYLPFAFFLFLLPILTVILSIYKQVVQTKIKKRKAA